MQAPKVKPSIRYREVQELGRADEAGELASRQPPLRELAVSNQLIGEAREAGGLGRGHQEEPSRRIDVKAQVGEPLARLPHTLPLVPFQAERVEKECHRIPDFLSLPQAQRA